MRLWDGKSKILDVRLNAEGRWEPRNDDEMDIEKPTLDSTQWHQDVYAKVEPLLGCLLFDPAQADKQVKVIDLLKRTNDGIKKHNKELGLGEDQFLIHYDMFIETFKKAAPYLARLKSHPDEEAERELKSMNEGLREYNNKHHYPEGWVIRIPEPPRQQTTTQTQGVRSTENQSRTIRKPKFLTITEKEGYVLDRGVEKEIAGYVPAGYGHQLLLREDGDNGYDIYELVRASKFGKKFIARNEDVLKGKKLRLGTPKSLEGKKTSRVDIGGVASTRRYPGNEPRDGWERETKTLVLMRFGTRETWYRRSTLGQEFGQETIDEKINIFRKSVGQKSPLPPTKRGRRQNRKDRAAVASDDEDEGSISVGEESTSGEEDGEVEDSEDSDDDGSSDDDQAELEVLTQHLKELKKRMKKKEKKPKGKGSAGSQKPKSKRSKAK